MRALISADGHLSHEFSDHFTIKIVFHFVSPLVDAQ
jgi:hypothetical protein